MKEYGHKINLDTHEIGHKINLPETGGGVQTTRFPNPDKSGCDGSCLNVPAWQSEIDAKMIEDMGEQLQAAKDEIASLQASLDYERSAKIAWLNLSALRFKQIVELEGDLVEARMPAWEKVKRYLRHLWREVL